MSQWKEGEDMREEAEPPEEPWRIKNSRGGQIREAVAVSSASVSCSDVGGDTQVHTGAHTQFN